MSTRTPTFSQVAARLPACVHCTDVHDREEYNTRHDGGQLRFGFPTCGRWFRPADRLSVFYELYDVLSLYRRGTHVDKMATSLLRTERGTRERNSVGLGRSSRPPQPFRSGIHYHDGGGGDE